LITMSVFLQLAFLFFLGSTLGWVMELLFRRWRNPEKKWINPGFCTGPYLPLYGFGLCLMYLLAELPIPESLGQGIVSHILRIIAMGLGATFMEYLAGILCLKHFKVRLWDYRDQRWNIQGIICPQFTVIWTLLAAFYYETLHERMLGAVEWLSHNLAYSFVVGMFFGILLIDVGHSGQLVLKLKRYAEENELIVRFEAIKDNIRSHHTRTKQTYRFFRPFRTDLTLTDHLKELRDSFEIKKQQIQQKTPIRKDSER